ncbi:MAG: glutathione synthase, partial [Vicinamibacteria bacterium]
LEMLTDTGTQYVIAQRYVAEVRQGDKRIILLDGKPIGATLRVPLPHEARANIHTGGQCVKSDIDERDEEICRTLAPRLRSDGLYLVGIDVIGGYLTEVNVTSPTGVQEINALNGVALEKPIIDFAETLVVEAKETAARKS